jgi:hypothetical protein
MADGRVVEEPMIVVNEVRIGNHILHNVEASVMPGNDMLLGFPVVNQIGGRSKSIPAPTNWCLDHNAL